MSHETQCFQSLCLKILEEPTLRKAQFHGTADIGRGATWVGPWGNYRAGRHMKERMGRRTLEMEHD